MNGLRTFEHPDFDSPSRSNAKRPLQPQFSSVRTQLGVASGYDFSRIPLHRSAVAPIQTKLAIGESNDAYEQEADRVAKQVMRTSEPQPERVCQCGGSCPSCKSDQTTLSQQTSQIQRIQATETGEVAPLVVDEVLSSPGRPLDPATRAFMEPRFGYDFSDVRVHTDARAAESARAMDALAYTVGSNIVFDQGQYKPNSVQDHVLAHELTHVVQQSQRTQAKQGAGVQRHMSDRESLNGMVQRAPRRDKSSNADPQVKFGPLTVGRDAGDVQRRQQIKRDARVRLPAIARSFVDLSFVAAQNGARTAAKPDDPVARENFHRALAGNLLWAATSLFARWHPAVIGMSFIGAAVGSGAANSSDDVMGEGEKVIANRLAQEADKLEAEVPPIAEAVADECGEKGISEPDGQDQLLWRTMFPPSSTRAGVPWETKRETLTDLTRLRVEWALKGFISQWNSWKQAIYECSKLRVPGDDGDREREMAQAAPPPNKVTGTVQAMRTGVVQRFSVIPFIFKKTKSKAQCESERPFRPSLTFGPER